MNYLDGYVEEILSEPYYDDYGSGIFRWWVEVSYVCYGIGAVTTLMFDTREEAEAVKPGYKFLNATWATKEEFDKAPVVGHIIEGIGLVFTDRGGHEVNA